MNEHNRPFLALVRNRVKFRLFLFKKLPAAFFSGVTVRYFDEGRCVVSVPFKWFTQNPFRSTYFACLSMAAEMSTGILAMAAIYGRPRRVSMLIVKNDAVYHKKATGLTLFECREGRQVQEAVEQAIATGTPSTVTCIAEGRNRDGELVATFTFTWSFRVAAEAREKKASVPVRD